MGVATLVNHQSLILSSPSTPHESLQYTALSTEKVTGCVIDLRALATLPLGFIPRGPLPSNFFYSQKQQIIF